MKRIVAAGSCWKMDRKGKAMLETAGYSLYEVENQTALLSLLSDGHVGCDVILYDGDLDDGKADFLQQFPKIPKTWPLLFITSRATIGGAVEVMRLGAEHFIAKPVHPKRILAAVADAIKIRAKQHEPGFAPQQTKFKPADIIPNGYLGFVGCSPPMLAVYDKVRRLGHSTATVFVTGESGTGKEVCAEAIHASGDRSQAPFIAVNCGAIPENLLESELFGHVKGSFSGATSDRQGAAIAANGGTLFLDEICEMPIHLQVKLLRFLQSGTVQRVGESRPIKVDLRIICATNRHPETEVAEGRFRSDLFYRLNVVRLEMPPLRARGDDISLLASQFLQQFGTEEGRNLGPLSRDAILSLNQRSWPGNVRELQNLIRSAVALGDPDLLLECNEHGAVGLPLPAQPTLRIISSAGSDNQQGQSNRQQDGSNWDKLSFAEVERMVIENAIARCGGNLAVAARQLQVSPSTLYRKKERWSQGMLHAC